MIPDQSAFDWWSISHLFVPMLLGVLVYLYLDIVAGYVLLVLYEIVENTLLKNTWLMTAAHESALNIGTDVSLGLLGLAIGILIARAWWGGDE